MCVDIHLVRKNVHMNNFYVTCTIHAPSTARTVCGRLCRGTVL